MIIIAESVLLMSKVTMNLDFIFSLRFYYNLNFKLKARNKYIRFVGAKQRINICQYIQGVPKTMTPFEMQISPKIITRNQ